MLSQLENQDESLYRVFKLLTNIVQEIDDSKKVISKGTKLTFYSREQFQEERTLTDQLIELAELVQNK